MPNSGPQLENGFTRIANELLEQILLAEFTKRELLIVFAIVRETYGYNRKSHRISGTTAGKMTGIPREHAARTIAILIRRKVVLNQPHTGYNVLTLNKNYNQWLPPEGSAKSALVPKQPQASAKTATKLVPNQHTTKDSKDRSKDRERTPAKKGSRWNGKPVPNEWRDWAVSVEHMSHVDVNREAEKFADYWRGAPGAKGVKLDWQATWRNWIRRNNDDGRKNRRLSNVEKIELAYRDKFAAQRKDDGAVVDADGWFVSDVADNDGAD